MYNRNSIRKYFIPVLLVAVSIASACAGNRTTGAHDIPDGFLSIREYIPSAQLDIRYYTSHNFVGVRIDGYDAPGCILSNEAATALKNVQEELLHKQQSLKIFDCYRPQQAVDHFVRWAKDLDDLKMKPEFYPFVDKKYLFRDGYIAAKSGHSRGSTLDLTVIDMKSNRELDMGTPFDFFDPLSHTINDQITAEQQQNRITLKTVMEKHGFKNLAEEWWHYTLENEPYPDRYFNFRVR